MPDLEKVVEALKLCASEDRFVDRCIDGDCPYNYADQEDDYCVNGLLRDALTLIEQLQEGNLSQQRTILKLTNAIRETAPAEYGKWQEYHANARGYGKIYYQHSCTPLLYDSPYYYCPHCGAKMERGDA